MVKHPLFGEVSKDFNEAAALEAYDLFMTQPEYGHVLLQMHAHERVSETKYLYPEVVDELIFKKFEARKELVKDAVLSGVINKSMTNSTIDEIVTAMDSISKAVDQYTSWERSQNVKEQRRGPGGRFIPMGRTKIDSPSPPDPHNKNQWKKVTESYDKVAIARGFGAPPEVPSKRPEFDAKHSAAYLQVAEALKEIDPGSLVMAEMTVRRHNRATGQPIGEPYTVTRVGADVGDFVRVEDFEAGEVPIQYKWYMDGDQARGGGFDLLTGAGMSGDAYITAAGMSDRFPGAAKEYQTKRGENVPEYGGQGYNRLSATANMIDTIGGDALSGKAKWALGAAKYVGDNGPEAEKVLGPTARRAAYRYRGVERKPDEKMDRAIAMSVAGSKSVDDARERLLHPVVSGEEVDGVYEESTSFSPFIKYWQNQLPKREHLNLHLNSGAIAPSQGVVFDAKGQIVTQAVGYGDDHYLPFNLQNLSRANRGEWVRTRTMGGPTTEDIYAALTTGTRSVTVVSHSGVYNVEFDESFRGGRRYNDKAARMVRRYSQLLDTLDAENTTLQDVPQDRREEIELKVHREILGDSKEAAAARKAKYDDLINAERQEPTASKAQQEMWKQEFIDNFEARQKKWDDNRSQEDVQTWEQMKARESIRAGRELTDDEAITALNQDEQFSRFMNKKRQEYKTLQAPLKLNGQGYYFALQALQEQFPYYIKRVEWYPPNEGQGGSVYGRDKGYVQRNYNRPKAAKEGFWAKDIEGYEGLTDEAGNRTGKVQANHTNYQNYSNRQRVNVGPGTSDPKYGGSGAKASVEEVKDTSAEKSPLGVRLNVQAATNSASLDNRRKKAVADLARDIAQSSMKAKDPADPNSEKGTKQIGNAGVGYPLLGAWATTEEKINNPDTQEATLKALEEELDSIFTGSGGTDFNAEAIRAAVKPKFLEQYNKTILGNRVKPVTYAGSAVSDDNSMFALGDSFMPGRSEDEYRTTATSDPDIAAYGRRPQRSDFPVAFRKAEAELLAMRDTSDKSASVEYLGQTYPYLDAGALEAQMAKDALGYIKLRQINRLLAGFSKPEEEPAATISPIVPAPKGPEPTPPGGEAVPAPIELGAGKVAVPVKTAAEKKREERGTETWIPTKEEIGFKPQRPREPDDDEK